MMSFTVFAAEMNRPNRLRQIFRVSRGMGRLAVCHKLYNHQRAWLALVLFFGCLCPVLLCAHQVLARGQAEIWGYVWHDWDENGQQDAGEPPLADVLLLLADEKGNLLASTATDAAGCYRFQGLEAGRYLLSETDPEGFSSTTPNLVEVVLDAQSRARHDFGDILVLPGCFRVVGGHVWLDGNLDGQQNDGEQGLAGVVIQVWDWEHRLVGLALSDALGSYAVRNLPADRYYVAVAAPSSLAAGKTPRYWGVDLRGCLPAEIDFGLNGQALPTLPASHARPGAQGSVARAQGSSSISGVVCWLPDNDGGEPRPLAGVGLVLTTAEGALVAAQRSDAQGRYTFSGLSWGTYYLLQEPVAGYAPVLDRFWGAVITDACEVIINLEHKPLSGPSFALWLPHVVR